MISAAQNRANLGSASRIVEARLGVDRYNLTQQQRVGYLQALALEILKYPDQFDELTLANARATAGRSYSDLEDASFDVFEFFGAAADEASALNEDVNPFSASNRQGFVKTLLVGVLVYFLAPRIIAALSKK